MTKISIEVLEWQRDGGRGVVGTKVEKEEGILKQVSRFTYGILEERQICGSALTTFLLVR